MNPEARLEVERHMRELDDAALRRLVVLEASNYQPAALDIARDELKRRHIPFLKPEEYWKQFPEEWLAGVVFCYRCWSETTDESPGHVVTLNLIGTRLLGCDDQCAVCGSVVQRMWFCIVLPILPLSRYRVIRMPRDEYIGRMLGKRDAVVGISNSSA